MMSTGQVNPMPFEDPDNPSQNDPETAPSDKTRAEAEDPLYESGEPDPDEAPVEEDPNDQLPRE
ncbi:hypothetical protein GCM10009789_25440 [Kribbella sancticallisti]|uniref:Uncharacterized protein n=1 Tax=Kribbella sancticallisti TaxID=460087 RepID=A0ABN2D6B8_9ACTN